MNVYDFDNTIYDGESCLDMFFFILKKNIGLLKLLPKTLHGFYQYKKGKVTLDDFSKKYAPIVEEFISRNPGVLEDTSEFWEKHIHKIKPFYKNIQKDDDLIITASPDCSVKEICKRLGIKNYICTIIEPNGKISRMCLRENKIKAFFEEYPNSIIDNFYTDSPENDAALIEISKNAYVVSKNKIKKIK